MKRKYKKTKLLDQHGNRNLLLPNFIKEKNDNGDIDIFLYYSLNYTSPERIVKKLEELNRVLKINRNDKTWSFLIESKSINKKIQVDLHIVRDTPENLSNYFNYYRVPYLYFILGMILNKLDIKLGIKGLNYTVTDSEYKTYFSLESKYENFLKKTFGIDIKDTFNISSYKEIQEFLVKTGLTDYDFFNLSKLRGDYLKKMRNNDKLAEIINGLPDPKFSLESYKTKFKNTVTKVYPFLEQKEKSYINKILKDKEQKKNKSENLKKLFGKELKDLDLNEKKLIPLLSTVIDELIILKEISLLLQKNFPGKKLYLVGGAVRDILLGKGNKDWDITGNYSSEEFQKVIGGTITEKFGTVFKVYKNLELEYTPFRTEGNYDGRKPGFVNFNASLEEDILRRDFTINSLYLDVDNLNIIDIYGGKNDLENKIIRAVGNPDDRFKEDYLRILRGIRLAAKIEGEIEMKTYNSMIDLSKNIKDLSDERVTEELFKGFNIKENRKYILYLDDFGNKSGLFQNILDKYRTLDSGEIYTLFFYLLGKDISRMFKISGAYSGTTKKLFLISKKVSERLELKSGMSKDDLIEYLYNLKVSGLSRKKYSKLLLILGNLTILDSNNSFTRSDIKNILNLKKKLDLENIPYCLVHLKENGIDLEKEIKENNLKGSEIRNYFKDKYIVKKSIGFGKIKKENLSNKKGYKFQLIIDEFKVDKFLIKSTKKSLLSFYEYDFKKQKYINIGKNLIKVYDLELSKKLEDILTLLKEKTYIHKELNLIYNDILKYQINNN